MGIKSTKIVLIKLNFTIHILYYMRLYVNLNVNVNTLFFADLGRTASHFYIKYDTVEVFNEVMQPIMSEGEIFSMISQAQEFQQLKGEFSVQIHNVK